MKTILTIILAFILLGCGSDDMATIGVETKRSLTLTNVTDDTQVYDSTTLTIGSHISDNSFVIINGNLWSAGLNAKGELGVGDTIQRTSFTDTGVADVKSVFSGADFTFILKKDGSLHGAGLSQRIGIGVSSGNTTSFVNINISDVKTVACGTSHAFIIKHDGSLWSTGNGGNGQTGLGIYTSVTSFTDTGMTNIKSVSAGLAHSAIVDKNGTLYGTGENSSVGLPSDVNVFTATDVTNAEVVSCGENFTMIIDTDGSVYGAGNNLYGQIGNGNNTNQPTYAATGKTAISIATGNVHTAIIDSSDNLLTTGNNFYGQLCIGTHGGGTDVNVFTDTTANANAIACGKFHTIAEKTDGILYSSGKNTNGQLALGNTTDVDVLTTTAKTPDNYVIENWTPHYQSNEVKIGDFRYFVGLLSTETPSIFTTLTQIGYVNQLKPFDNQNITPAISSSPMTYTITATEEFNAFTLAKVLATSVTYTFKNSLGATIKTDSVAIDVKRDKDGILSDYPTTVVFYADTQMEAGSTVEISLTYSGEIQLGDFTLNNSIEAGFTNNKFTIGIKDFNDYTPDPWGQIPESVKAVVATFDISMDIYFENLSSMASFIESIAGKNVTVDGSDGTIDALTKRVRVTNPTISSEEKDNEVGRMALFKFKAQEIA